MNESDFGTELTEIDASGRSRRARRFRQGGLLILAAALLYLFAVRVRWRDLAVTLGSFDPRLLPRIVVAQLGFMVLGGIALWLLLAGRGALRFGVFMTAYWRGVAVGFWTPAAVGELSLAWFLRPSGVLLRQSLAAMTVDKLVTAATWAVLAYPALEWKLGSLAAPSVRQRGTLVLVATLALACSLLIAWQFRGPRRATLALLAQAKAYAGALGEVVRSSPLRLAGNVTLTLLRVLASAAVLKWSIDAFEPGHQASLYQLVVFSTAARLVSLVLPAPHGLGVYEVALIELMSPISIPPSAIVSGVVLSRLVALLLVGLGLLLPRPEPEPGAK